MSASISRAAKILAPAIILAIVLTTPAFARNLHLVDELPNGFALYRCGKPTEMDVGRLRHLGIEEMCVLAGNAGSFELKYRDQHPDLVIVYNVKQDDEHPPSEEFLDWFDEWVETARAEGKKIAFRCNCGCHRTGRLAAYYRMKWMGTSLEEAIEEMKALGHHMGRYPHLWAQVEALAERAREHRAAR